MSDIALYGFTNGTVIPLPSRYIQSHITGIIDGWTDPQSCIPCGKTHSWEVCRFSNDQQHDAYDEGIMIRDTTSPTPRNIPLVIIPRNPAQPRAPYDAIQASKDEALAPNAGEVCSLDRLVALVRESLKDANGVQMPLLGPVQVDCSDRTGATKAFRPRRAFMFDNLGPSHPSIPKAFVPFEHFDLLQDATLTADLTAFSGFTHGCLLSTFLTTLEEGASTCPGVLIFQGSRDMNTQAGSQWRILVAWFRTGRWAEPTAIFSPTTSCLVYETPS
ncbi:uncharacterized protein MKK02DRAFT_40792 [Dioszegia hungarica]|uniref:Uncharacterized protein n=1 Tax=Dioszegia hungarica TaxID=4972 RepID=A0AA38LSD6_9TREE|nr:uncharacterized protein MKK02DRAFT_40792 [Dioszegia hungarica]KAI9632489.1 hypothetical protein MKK02DRAFT_40792 [Dioszegia hungarica]